MTGTQPRQPRIGLREAQYLLLLSGDSAWLWAWSVGLGVWLGGTREPLLPMPALLALLLVSTISTRLVTLARRPALLTRVALALLALAAAWAVALAELPALRNLGQWTEAWEQLLDSEYGFRTVLAVAFAVFAWRRGIGFGRERLSLFGVAGQFQTGVVALCSLFIPVALAGPALPVPAETLMISTLVVLSTGLIGMPLARVVEVNEAQARGGGAAAGPAGSWLGMLLGAVGAILAMTLLLAQLLTFDRIVALYEALRGPVGDLLWGVVYIVAMPVGFLVRGFFYLLGLLIPSKTPRRPPQPNDVDWLDRLREQGEPASLSPEAILALKIGLGLALAVASLWLLVRAFSRLHRWREEDGVAEIRDFVWRWPGPRDLWRWLLGCLEPARRRMSLATALAGATKRDGSVRGLYREFLLLGAATGRGRRISETPLEYERRLDGATPGAEEVGRITRSYVQVRYAPPDSPPPDLSAVAAALARLRDLWRRKA